jgi:hypothetical protein
VAQKVAEIAGVERLQAVLIGLVEFAALAVGEGARVAFGNVGRSPLFFQPSIICANWRAGQRLSSSPSAWINCLISRTTSSVSRMVKPLFNPASSACRRRILTPIEWNVPSQGIPSTASPTRMPMRDFISRAALLVKVTARIWLG